MRHQQVGDFPGAGVHLDLDPAFTELREHTPVSWVRFPDGRQAWLVTRYEDARRVLSDPVFSRAAASARSPAQAHLTDMDPPEHTRVRRLVTGAFTRRRVEQLRTSTQHITDRLLDEMSAAGPPADVVSGLAFPLPVTVIGDLLGIPHADRDQFVDWAEAFLATTAYTAQQIADARTNLTDYLAGLVAERRAHPSDDLLGALVQVRDVDGALSEPELVNLGVTLLVAGHETTANQITNLTYTLLTRPDHLAYVRDKPGRLPRAIEELLRLIPLGAGAGMPRVAVGDVHLGGVLIKAGERVYVSRAAANRDQAVFPAGDQLDFTRDHEVPHLAFGYGIHRCLGAHLARMELQIALGSLLFRFPDVRLAIPETDLRWKTGLVVRGLRELPISWGTTTSCA